MSTRAIFGGGKKLAFSSGAKECACAFSQGPRARMPLLYHLFTSFELTTEETLSSVCREFILCNI